MKLVIRIFAAIVVLAGVGAAAVTAPSSAHALPSNQAVSAAMPGPVCGPGVPTCTSSK
jgi:hypothetical protein